jgi:hypothetical protein
MNETMDQNALGDMRHIDGSVPPLGTPCNELESTWLHQVTRHLGRAWQFTWVDRYKSKRMDKLEASSSINRQTWSSELGWDTWGRQ